MSDNKKEGLICLHCNEEMAESSFYKSRSQIIDQSRYSICKECSARLSNIDMETFQALLRVLDIPFMPEEYRDSQTKDNPIGHYFRVINNPRKKYKENKLYKDLTYSDSPENQTISDVDEYIITDNEELGKLIALFGNQWSSKELTEMDKELDEMIVQYGGRREDLATIDLYSQIVLIGWLGRKAYNDQDMKTGNDMFKMRAKLLKDNGLTLQDMRDKTNNDALGTKIDMAEDRPNIPDKKYHDVDGIWFMFQKLIKHMERFAGADKSSVDDDYVEMQKYVDNNPHYSTEME